MKNQYFSPEFKFVFLNAERILTESDDKDPYVSDPFEPTK